MNRSSVAPTFESRDPTRAEFWDERYAAQFTPWEAAGLPPTFDVLAASLFDAAHRPAPRVLMPGCGVGHELAWLAEHGFEVLGIDIAEQALARARKGLPQVLAERCVRAADFFAFDDGHFDWIYERAFLAALPPSLWPRWAEQCTRLTQPGAWLAGYFCVESAPTEPRRGPPFAATHAELAELLGARFRLVHEIAIDAALSVPVFAGRERWIVWQRV